MYFFAITLPSFLYVTILIIEILGQRKRLCLRLTGRVRLIFPAPGRIVLAYIIFSSYALVFKQNDYHIVFVLEQSLLNRQKLGCKD